MTERELKLLQQMAREYPTVQAASAEIINLTAILNLPKGTEHFMSDIHGEHEAFLHILNNGSGRRGGKDTKRAGGQPYPERKAQPGGADILPQGKAEGSQAHGNGHGGLV